MGTATFQKTGYLHVDLNPIKNLYIHCPNLSTNTTVAPNGASGVVKRVPVTAGYGFQINDAVLNAHDHVDVSRLVLNVLKFDIRDKYGHHTPLHGHTWSCSLVFAITNTP